MERNPVSEKLYLILCIFRAPTFRHSYETRHSFGE